MFLKALTIKGFKSFADSAELKLEPGITVVVGPNGSGKSNVVDAMAWVLGAQAPSAVRSQKMEDVIFAGTASRKALGRAEVSLTIDNNDGVLPIEYSEVAITRTLFRSGESDYAINGTSCRLLDIQELLSDSGVGRQQHIIVSQGQIDAVLNSRPEERRGIIEEAAGVLKYRKRRERAERRLEAAGENLSRLQDLLREVRRQIKPLERQAEAARRHGELVEELGALKVHLAGRELKALTGRLEAGRRDLNGIGDREQELTARLATLDAAVLEGEAELSALGTSDVGDLLSRTRSIAERVRGQRNVVAERLARLESELQAAVDDGLVANLEAESARIERELREASTELDDMKPEFDVLSELESSLTSEQLTFDTEWGDSVGPGPNRAAELRAQLEALNQAEQRSQQELARFDARVGDLDGRRDRAKQTRDQAQAAIDDYEVNKTESEQALADVQSRFREAASDLDRSRNLHQSAMATHTRSQARIEALEHALDAARSRAGADALQAVDGVLGTLLDLVDVDEGFELAAEAAMGDALLNVVVDNPRSGRQALAVLAEQDLAGGVLALGAGGVSSTTTDSPAVGQPLRSRVRAQGHDINRVTAVDQLLDVLVPPSVVVIESWTDHLDDIASQPQAVFVTRDGDRFSGRGWRLRQASSGATGAALEAARTQDQEAATELASALENQTASQRLFDELEEERTAAEKRVQGQRADVERQVANREQANSQIEQIERDRQQLLRQRTEVAERRQQDGSEVAALTRELPAVENEEAEHQRRAEALARSRTSLEERTREVATRRTELEVRTAAVEERCDLLVTRRSETESRLVRLVREREQARSRRVRIEQAIAVVNDLDQALTGHQRTLGRWIDALSVEQRAQSEAARKISSELSTRRGDRSSAEKEVAQLRERRGRLELDETEFRVKLEALTEALRRELEVDPDIAMTAALPEIVGGQSPEARVRELERELKIMGPINPLALEEFEELKERHEFLDGQVNDVKATRRDLHRLIRSIDEEIVGVFSAAFADVSSNFTGLFSTLFPGGKGGLKLTNADDILNCGIEIEAKPSGKNVKKLSLLSGGERSLVALAFLFAVFRSRPSPFYVMDEVEAALDDMNLSRFLALVEEFRKEAQLIIVSHQKRTMEAADVLYGVSMKPGGSSRVVTERAEKVLD